MNTIINGIKIDLMTGARYLAISPPSPMGFAIYEVRVIDATTGRTVAKYGQFYQFSEKEACSFTEKFNAALDG